VLESRPTSAMTTFLDELDRVDIFFLLGCASNGSRLCGSGARVRCKQPESLRIKHSFFRQPDFLPGRGEELQGAIPGTRSRCQSFKKLLKHLENAAPISLLISLFRSLEVGDDDYLF
jgi:hypothetical protein